MKDLERLGNSFRIYCFGLKLRLFRLRNYRYLYGPSALGTHYEVQLLLMFYCRLDPLLWKLKADHSLYLLRIYAKLTNSDRLCSPLNTVSKSGCRKDQLAFLAGVYLTFRPLEGIEYAFPVMGSLGVLGHQNNTCLRLITESAHIMQASHTSGTGLSSNPSLCYPCHCISSHKRII